jgi:uroporphyrinogen decarboxylase
MLIREKFFKAMRREAEGFVPFEFLLCPSLREEFAARTGTIDYDQYYDFPTRVLSVKYQGDFDRFRPYFENTENLTFNDWGVANRKGSFAHFTEMVYPMKNFETVGEFASYPYPDPIRDYRWEDFGLHLKEVKARDLVAVANMEITIFEIAWYLRGMEQFMIDLIVNPDLAEYHLDRITAIRCQLAGRYAGAGCDVLRLGDDVSTQLDMMMNPETWRRYFKPRLAKVIAAAKEEKPDILIFYHGDGNLQKIIPDLIEAGVEILNPVQPECMDPVAIKRLYGEKLSFWGTIGTQTTMPFGTAAEVREVCRRMIAEMGRGGGLLLAPTHMLEPEVPWANIESFIDTVKEYNHE